MEKCSICNSNNLVSRDWGGIECLTCFSIIPKKIPSEIEIINHYSSDLNTSDYYHKEALKGDKLIRYANWYLKLIRKYILHGKLFDIGSGVTPFPQLAFKNGFKTTSGDIKQYYKSNSNVKRVEISVNREIKELKYLAKYDIVTFFAVVEHTSNPELAIKNLTKLCKENGYIFLTTPDIGKWYHNFALGGSKWFDPPGHLHIISGSQINKIFERYNCKLISRGIFDISLPRYLIRYGICFVEGAIGYVMYKINKRFFNYLKNKNRSFGMGMAYYVYKKNKIKKT